MASLPMNMQLEVFIRLPVKTLLRFKAACKHWCYLFSHPLFVKMHRIHAIETNNTFLMVHCLIGRNKRSAIYSIKYESLSSKSSAAKCKSFGETVDMDYLNLPSDTFALLGSCDGLVCLLDTSLPSSEDDICLWNPSTKEHKKIPVPPYFEKSNTDQGLYGFGYDDKVDGFKLVRVAEILTPYTSSDSYDDGYVIQVARYRPNSRVDVSRFKSHSVIQIYTLASNSWRLCQCQAMPYYFPGGTVPGVVVKGALHWCAANKCDHTEAIISFDMTNETFKEIARLTGPLQHPIERDSEIDNNNLGVLGGCICVLHKTYGVRVDVWVMQEYGVNGSWTKRLTITQKSITKTRRLRVVCELQNTGILFDTDNRLVHYDAVHNTATKLRIPGARMLCGAEKCVASLEQLGVRNSITES